MNVIKLFLICIISLSHYNLAYIFDTADDEDKNKTINVASYEYDNDCLLNETIYQQIKDFRIKYDQIKDFSEDEVKNFCNNDYENYHTKMCEEKTNIARSVTDGIEKIGKYCVNDSLRKQFIINTLLMLQSNLDFICSMSESIFRFIYRNNAVASINEKMNELDKCRENSFKVLFFDKKPAKLFWIQLLNGKVCNFDYDAMLTCASKILESCGAGAIESLSYLFDVIKRNSLCYKRKSISEILDSSLEKSGSIVT